MRGGRKENELLLSTQLVTLCERAGADSSSQRKIFSHADTRALLWLKDTQALGIAQLKLLCCFGC